MVSKQQITDLREAIKKDKYVREQHKAHLEHIKALQELEASLNEQLSSLKTRLKGVETEIVAALGVKFDYSDDMTIAAAEASLEKMEAEYGTQEDK